MIHYFIPKGGLIEWANKRSLYDFLLENDGKKMWAEMDRETGKRTGTQNNALHKYYEMVSTALSEKGFTFDFQLGEKIVKLEWTPNLVKEAMWKPIQKALTGKTSTTKLDKVSEIDQVYDHINRFLSNKPFFIHVPFPKEDPKLVAMDKVDYPENNLGESKF